MATVIEIFGRWRYEQLAPLDLCGLHADLGRLLTPALRSLLIKALLILGARPQDGETLAARGRRVLAAFERHDGPALAGFVRGLMEQLDRSLAELVEEIDAISLALMELARALDSRAVMRLMVEVLVVREGRRGGLSFLVTAGAKNYVPISTVDDLNEQAQTPNELWRLFAWALMVNLRPTTAALRTWVERGLTERPGPTSAPTPPTDGPSSPSPKP